MRNIIGVDVFLGFVSNLKHPDMQTFLQYLRQLQIFFLALFLGSPILFGVLWFVNQGQKPDDGPALLLYYCVGMTFLCIGVAFVFPKRLLDRVKSSPDLSQKLLSYRTNFILRMALLEGASILCAISYHLLVSHPVIPILMLLALVAMIYFCPHREGVIRDLDLSMQEQARIDDPNEGVVEILQHHNPQ
jgi:hypothetical protein